MVSRYLSTASNLEIRHVTHPDGMFSGQSLCFLRPLFRELLSVQPYTLMIAQIMSLKLLIFPMIQEFTNHEIKTYIGHWKQKDSGTFLTIIVHNRVQKQNTFFPKELKSF